MDGDAGKAPKSELKTAEVTSEELVERARELAPTIADRAGEASELRMVPEATIAELVDAGLFKAVTPRRFGGYGMNPKVLYEAQIELGKACASSSWVYGVLGVHAWQLALFPLEAQEEVWGDDPTTLISSSYMPVGKVKRVDGGFEISGHWSFSSGCDHGQWIFLGGFVPVEDGRPPDMRTFLLPRADYEIVDNWHVTGLKASGSKDILVQDAFVPEHRTHEFSHGFKASSPGNEVNPEPGYRYPFGQIHTRSVSTPALGAALGALEHYTDWTKSRVSQATGGKAKEDFVAAMACAEAEGAIDREILTLHRNFDEMFALIEKGERIPLERRARFRYDAAAAVSAAVGAVDKLFAVGGGRALFEGNVLNRHYQDVHAIRAHHANQPEKPALNYGGLLLGNSNTDFFI